MGIGSDGEEFRFKSALPTGVYAFPNSKLLIHFRRQDSNTLARLYLTFHEASIIYSHVSYSLYN